MKIYEIVIQGDGSLMSSEKSHYVMAENFDEAITQAHKRLAQVDEDFRDNAYIESISEQFELEVIK
jgi:hypothetical protein